MPNGLGGFGLPRYMKQSMEYANSEVYENAEGQSPSVEPQEGELSVQPSDPPRATGGADQELSPNASEFKPNPSA
jgi:hypothetical protein